ncbi:MAG: PEP-CTERM sorting domain-containing protein [Candidatus Omnitrophota bacterium]
MKKIFFLYLIVLFLSFSQPAFAYFIGNEITTLNGIYGSSWDGSSNELWDVLSANGYTALANDVQTDVSGGTPSSNYHVYKNTYWKSAGYYSLMVDEVAAYSPYSSFGWYIKNHSGDVGDLSKTTWGEIFSGANSQGATFGFFNPNEIGFWINPNGASGLYYFTDTSLNGGDLQALVFSLNGYGGFGDDYLIALEDLKFSGWTDNDFQDMIIRLRPIIPEPGTMSLLGLGLLGVFGFRKKRS